MCCISNNEITLIRWYNLMDLKRIVRSDMINDEKFFVIGCFKIREMLSIILIIRDGIIENC